MSSRRISLQDMEEGNAGYEQVRPKSPRKKTVKEPRFVGKSAGPRYVPFMESKDEYKTPTAAIYGHPNFPKTRKNKPGSDEGKSNDDWGQFIRLSSSSGSSVRPRSRSGGKRKTRKTRKHRQKAIDR